MPSVICPECGIKVRALVPRGGDGSALVYARHLDPSGVTNCIESRSIVEPWRTAPAGSAPKEADR